MNVNGALRIDLSGFVTDFGMLTVGDEAASYTYRRMGGFVGAVLLDVGDARVVTLLDSRIVTDSLANAESVTVIGSRPRGVVSAVEALGGAS